MKNKKIAPPKRDENLKVKQQAYTRLDAPKPSANKQTEADRLMEEKAIAKAQKEEAKRLKKAKSNKSLDSDIRQAHKEEKILKFHFFRFIFHWFIFLASTVVLIALVFILYGSGIDITIGTNVISMPELESKAEFGLGLLTMFLFAIWMAEFQLGYRRFFRIGRHERIRKAIAKKEKKASKKK